MNERVFYPGMRKLIFLFLIPVIVWADPAPLKIEKGLRATIPLVAKDPLTNAKVIEIMVDSMVVMSDSGIDTIAYSDLPSDWQKAAGWSPSEQRERAEILAKKNADLAKEKADAIADRINRDAIWNSKRRLNGNVTQVLPEGLLIYCSRPRPDPQPFNYGSGGSLAAVGGDSRPAKIIVPVAPKIIRPSEEVGDFLLLAHPNAGKKADRSSIDVDAIEEGIFSYTSVDGANRTVKKFRVVQVFE